VVITPVLNPSEINMLLSELILKYRNVKDTVTAEVAHSIERLDFVLGEVHGVVSATAKFLKDPYLPVPVLAGPSVASSDETSVLTKPKKKVKAVEDAPESAPAGPSLSEIQECRDVCEIFRTLCLRSPGALAVARVKTAGLNPHIEVALCRILRCACEDLVSRLENR
jgi:hypothetical protein